MKTQDNPTVDELNVIQGEWMALSHEAPEKEKQRVFAMMKRYPSVYVSATHNQALGVVIYQGMPLNQPMAFVLAMALCRRHNGRTDVVWAGEQWRAA